MTKKERITLLNSFRRKDIEAVQLYTNNSLWKIAYLILARRWFQMYDTLLKVVYSLNEIRF